MVRITSFSVFGAHTEREMKECTTFQYFRKLPSNVLNGYIMADSDQFCNLTFFGIRKASTINILCIYTDYVSINETFYQEDFF